MKKILMALTVICFYHGAKAQLTNSKWTGTITAGANNYNVLWRFSTDSAYFYNNDDNSLLDVSVFKVHDTTLVLKTVSGVSSCNAEEGLYKFVLKDKVLKFYLVKDDCSDRINALDKSTFTRKED